MDQGSGWGLDWCICLRKSRTCLAAVLPYTPKAPLPPGQVHCSLVIAGQAGLVLMVSPCGQDPRDALSVLDAPVQTQKCCGGRPS